jgi:hypothetical protein
VVFGPLQKISTGNILKFRCVMRSRQPALISWPILLQIGSVARRVRQIGATAVASTAFMGLRFAEGPPPGHPSPANHSLDGSYRNAILGLAGRFRLGAVASSNGYHRLA